MDYNYYSIGSSEESLLKEKVAIYNRMFKGEILEESKFVDFLHFTEPVRVILSKSNKGESPVIQIARDKEDFSKENFFENYILDFIIYYDEASRLNSYPTLLNIDDVLFSLKNELNNPRMVCGADILEEPAITPYQVVFTFDNTLTFSINIDLDKKIYYLSRTTLTDSPKNTLSEETISTIEKFVFNKLLSKVC